MQPDGGAALTDRPRRLGEPVPWGLVPAVERPGGGQPRRARPGLRDHLPANQQPEFHADTGKADALAAGLGAGGEIVIAGQLAPAHAGAIVHDGERGRDRIDLHPDGPCPRVERVGDDLREHRLLETPRIGVTQVFQQVAQVNAGLAHDSSRQVTAPAD